MNATTQIWILTGLTGALVLIVGYLLKTAITEILSKLQDIVEEIKQLNKITSAQETSIKYLQEMHLDFATRLNSHTERLFRLELKISD